MFCKQIIIINSILLIFCGYSFFTDASHHHQNNSSDIHNTTIPKTFTYPKDQPIYIQSNEITVNYPNQIQFSGNVNVMHNINTLTSDKLILKLNKKKNNQLEILEANGNVHYNNNIIAITGTHAQINLNNKNTNLYEGTYHLLQSHIHGIADTVMQRQNNRYTIITHGNFTACTANDYYWSILGSKILYDHNKNTIDIWDALFKIKKIPIFYSPYLSCSLNTRNMLTSYIPTIKYNNKYGLTYKIPCPLNLPPTHYSGSISPCYQSHGGIVLKTKIHYSTKPGSGLIIHNISTNNKKHNQQFPINYYHDTHWKLYWKHHSFLNKKWHFNTDYITANHFYDPKNIHNEHIYYTYNNHINQKFLLNYNNKHWHANLAYLGINHNQKRSNNNYIATPLLEVNSYYNNIKHTPFSLQIFNQLTKFTPINNMYPTTIRIHTRPTLIFSKNENWGTFNITTKLNMTHYQQNNIHYYNAQNTHICLKNTVNRIIPQFKINSTIILSKNTDIQKKYKYTLKPRLQYLYTPYRFQENIGIYDTSIIHINYKNLFHDTIYSGLDRIDPTHKIIGDVTIHCFNKKNELFYVSCGQTSCLIPFYIKNIQKIPNPQLISGIGHWNINNYWNFHIEMQYNTQNNTFSFGNTILQHTGKKNQILQTHYRYIDKKYLTHTLMNLNTPFYSQTISQFGMFIRYPLSNNWKISCSRYYNIKIHQLIDQTIGIQYITPCWKINSIFERKIIGWNQQKNNNIYDNKIKLNIKIYNETLNTSNPYKIKKIGILPYQYIF